MQRTDALKITAALAIKPTGSKSGIPWEVEEEFYLLIVEEIPDAMARDLLRWILVECVKYRPTTDMIMAWYLRQTGRVQGSPERVVAEIRSLLEDFGMYIPDPARPNIRRIGVPPMSREAQRVVATYGGWIAFCQVPIRSPELFWREVRETAVRVLAEEVSEAVRGDRRGAIPSPAKSYRRVE